MTRYVETCLAGHTAEKMKHKKNPDRYSAAFDLKLCQGCPHADRCHAKPDKNMNYLRYKASSIGCRFVAKPKKTKLSLIPFTGGQVLRTP